MAFAWQNIIKITLHANILSRSYCPKIPSHNLQGGTSVNRVCSIPCPLPSLFKKVNGGVVGTAYNRESSLKTCSKVLFLSFRLNLNHRRFTFIHELCMIKACETGMGCQPAPSCMFRILEDHVQNLIHSFIGQVLFLFLVSFHYMLLGKKKKVKSNICSPRQYLVNCN